MIKMMVALQRQPHLTRPEFLAYWSDVHAPLVVELAQVLGIRRYVQCHPISGAEGDGSGGVRDCDGIAEVWFRSVEPEHIRRDDPAYLAAARRLRTDENNFMDRARSIVWWGAERTVI